MANNTFQAVTIGYPESRILLSQCAVYLATSPSNASYLAIGTAQQLVKQTEIFRFLFIYATRQQN
jgi:putative ATPase